MGHLSRLPPINTLYSLFFWLVLVSLLDVNHLQNSVVVLLSRLKLRSSTHCFINCRLCQMPSGNRCCFLYTSEGRRGEGGEREIEAQRQR